jgi:hypothetical protein
LFKALPDKSYVLNKDECKGGKRAKERFIVLLCAKWNDNEKLKTSVFSTYKYSKTSSEIDSQ